MTPKILALISSCGECPKYQYYSGGQHVCSLVDQPVLDKQKVAKFCPLPDFPSETIASMEQTFERLRKPNEYSLQHAVLSYLSSKLGALFTPSGNGILINLAEEGKTVYMDLGYVTNIDPSRQEVNFIYDKNDYKLCVGGISKPELYMKVKDEHPEVNGRWTRIELAKK
jgi:hypothetical protein